MNTAQTSLPTNPPVDSVEPVGSASPELGAAYLQALVAPSLPTPETTSSADAIAPLYPELLSAVPAPLTTTLQDLQAALANYRVLIVRFGSGVSWILITALGGSLLIHLFLIASILFGSWWAMASLGMEPHSVWDLTSHRGGTSGSGGGSAKGSIVMRTPDPRPATPQPVRSTTPVTPPVPMPPPTPNLIPPPTNETAPRNLLRTDTPETLDLPGAMVIATGPKPRLPAANTPAIGGAIALAPPLPIPTAAQPAKAVFVQPIKPAPSTVKRTRGGIIDDTQDGEEYSIDLMKPGAGGGSGSGSGDGRGNGKGNERDRGPSAANLASPLPLDYKAVEFPPILQAKMSGKRVEFEVMVLANGTVGELKLIESSGSPEIDTICKAAIARTKFRPAYEQGKPVDRAMNFIWN